MADVNEYKLEVFDLIMKEMNYELRAGSPSLVFSKMWDWRQLQWVNYLGWWPKAAKTKKWQQISWYYGLFLFAFDFLQLGPEFIALYTLISEGSMKGAIANLTTTLLGCLCAIKIFSLIVYSEEISSLIDSLIELDSSILPNVLGEQGKIIKINGDHRCKLTLIPLIGGMLSVLHWVLRPLILLFTDNVKTTIIDVWIPWSIENFIGWLVLYFIQIVHVSTAIYGLITFDSIFFCLSEIIITQLTLLSLALNKINFSNTGNTGPKRIIKQRKIQMLTLDICVDFHRKLLSMISAVIQITDIIQIAQVVALTGVFCLTVYEASSMEGVTINKVINLIEMGLAFMFYMLMYCHYSTELAQKCLDIGRAAYMNNWYEGCIKDKKCLIMIVERSKKPPKFGNFLNVNLNTFVSVLKTAFSYYNVLKAFDIK